MIADTAEMVEFNVIKAGIFPVPLTGSPIAEFELVHI